MEESEDGEDHKHNERARQQLTTPVTQQPKKVSKPQAMLNDIKQRLKFSPGGKKNGKPPKDK